MSPSKLFFKTIKFCWLKLLLGLVYVVATIILMLLGVLILSNVSNGTAVLILIGIIVVAIKALNYFLNHYVGYLVKAGHVAVITEMIMNNEVPEEGMVTYAFNMVKKRFVQANVFFIIDKLVNSSVRQLQRGVNKVGNLLNKIPGMQYITKLINLFIAIFLGYIDECVLGYSFTRQDEGAFKSSVDGVVIYFQNTKKMLKSAVKTVLMLLLIMAGLILLFFLPILGIANAAGSENATIIALVIAVACAFAIKSAFVDSYIMIRIVQSYMEVAPSTVITFDLYGKLCKLSRKFKSLFGKAQEESPITEESVSMANGAVPAYADAPTSMVHCPACGASNAGNQKFCSNCGNPLQ